MPSMSCYRSSSVRSNVISIILELIIIFSTLPAICNKKRKCSNELSLLAPLYFIYLFIFYCSPLFCVFMLIFFNNFPFKFVCCCFSIFILLRFALVIRVFVLLIVVVVVLVGWLGNKQQKERDMKQLILYAMNVKQRLSRVRVAIVN